MKTILPFYIRVTILLFLLLLIIFILIIGRELFIPLTISVFLTFILLPVSEKMESWHMPRSLAVFFSILLAFIILSGFVFFLYTQLQNFSDDYAGMKEQVETKADALQHFIDNNFHVSKTEQAKWFNKKVTAALDQGDQYLIAFFTTTGTLITNLLLIPLYIYFLTLYRDKIKKFVIMVAGSEQEHTIEIIHKVLRVAQKYLKGLMLDMLIVATLLSIGFMLFHLKHAILFGLIVAALNIILPYMGITIGSILPFLMMMLTNDSLGSSAGIIGFCAAMQFADNHFINPYVVGSSVSINPLTAFIGLVASAMIWGIYGMLLCIPAIGMIKVVCDNVDMLKPYGFIIGQELRFGAPGKKRLIRKKLLKKTKE